jgi:hypothetical protein
MSEDTATIDKVAKIGSHKMMERVGKLLRQAETERAAGNIGMADNYMSKAMDLSAAYTIDIDLARANTAKKEKVEEPEERKCTVAERTAQGKVPADARHMQMLLAAIGASYDMKCLYSNDGRLMWLTGFPSDHEMVERIFAMLSVQMVSEADAGLRAGKHKEVRRVRVTERVPIAEEDRAWGEQIDPYSNLDKRYAHDEGEVGSLEWSYSYSTGREYSYTLAAPPASREVDVLDEHGMVQFEEREVSAVDGRVWRKNFYEGFIAKSRERLRVAREKALKAAGVEKVDETTEKGLVLLDKKEQIDEHYEKVVLAAHGRIGSWKAPETKEAHVGGIREGITAAEKARLGDENDLDRGKG